MEQMESHKIDIKSMNRKELTDFLLELGEKSFRAQQIYQWLHIRQVDSFDDMTNISNALKEKLKEKAYLTTLKKEEVQISALDGTRKYLFMLADGNVIESVLMKYKHGNFFAGGLSDGLPLLCLHTGRIGAGTDSGGDARPDLPDWQGYRGAHLECGGYGDGRAVGQL